ncbi:MAG: alpha/beta hydrolase, partial [Loktanella sp.]|nr:alpha/beta hydrolase [Loktanella sp.]
MTCTLLIPGLDAARDPHWLAWWQKNDPMAMTLLPDDLSDPHPDAWEAEIAGALLHHPGTILVAHGAGALVVARMLATWPHLKISGALLVALVDPDRDPRLQHFTRPDPSPCPVPMTIVASRNDPHQPFVRARAMARDYGAGFVDLG